MSAPKKRINKAWASAPKALRGHPSRSFNLSRGLHAWLDEQRDAGANLSELAERALLAERARLKKNDAPAE